MLERIKKIINRSFCIRLSGLICLFFILSSCAVIKKPQQQVQAAGSIPPALCSKASYYCLQTKPGDTWQSLFPLAKDQDIVQRLNGFDVPLQPKIYLAVPSALEKVRTTSDVLRFAPFKDRIKPSKHSVIMVNLTKRAFAAYDRVGNLVLWGPITSGQDWCSDTKSKCNTPVGIYLIRSKGGPNCISTQYPIDKVSGGAPMPYCMFFYEGYALHGSTLPGYNDSHGCVHLFYRDAEWLNKNFVEFGRHRTMVIIKE